MPVETGPCLDTKDVYIDYPFEDVMFRRMQSDDEIYKKFYGRPESPHAVPHNNPLFADALRSGEEITKEQYDRGYADSRPS